MAKTVEVSNRKGEWMIDCPGCKMAHSFFTEHPDGQTGPCWSFNNNIEKPTISPSLLVRWPYKDKMNICHSFITDGKIQFLGDCTHSLAGKTVDLLDV